MSDSTKKLLIIPLLTSLLLITTLPFFAADKKALSFSVTEVSPGLYALMGVGGFTGGNIGLSVGVDGVVMIDDSMPPMLDIMKTAIASVTDKPIDFLINTHVHGDHIGNNASIAASGTWIVAHQNLRKYLLENGQQTKKGKVPTPKEALPVITFPRSMDFFLNGLESHIFHVPHAHTDGDAVIHFKNVNVIHTGDILFNRMFPFIDINKGGCVHGYLRAQRQILTLVDEKTKIIPGHGPLANKKDLENSIDLLEDSIKLITALIAKGKSEQQVVDINPLTKYDAWSWSFITTEKMTRQVYQSLQKAKDHTDHKMHHEMHHKMHAKPMKNHPGKMKH